MFSLFPKYIYVYHLVAFALGRCDCTCSTAWPEPAVVQAGASESRSTFLTRVKSKCAHSARSPPSPVVSPQLWATSEEAQAAPDELVGHRRLKEQCWKLRSRAPKPASGEDRPKPTRPNNQGHGRSPDPLCDGLSVDQIVASVHFGYGHMVFVIRTFLF